jgi:hypothetical protein
MSKHQAAREGQLARSLLLLNFETMRLLPRLAFLVGLGLFSSTSMSGRIVENSPVIGSLEMEYARVPMLLAA